MTYQIILGVYGGWANPVYFSEEDTSPASNTPRALFSSVLAVSAVYVLINAALFYAVPVAILRTSELPVAAAASSVFGPFSIKVVAAVAIVVMVSCNHANIMVAPRILCGLAADGLFPSGAMKVNRGGTPSVGLVITRLCTTLLTLTGKFEAIFLAMGAAAVLPVLVVEAAFSDFENQHLTSPRRYRALGYPWLPAAALLIDAILLVLFIASDIKQGFFIVTAVSVCLPIGWFMRNRQQTRT